jgi:hypothetical protein
LSVQEGWRVSLICSLATLLNPWVQPFD